MFNRKLAYLLIGLAFNWLVVFSAADIFNGSFELSDPENDIGVKPPTGWECRNYTNVISRFDMSFVDGVSHSWSEIIVDDGLDPYDGDYMVLLSTGDTRPDIEVDHAEIIQELHVQAGERISGVFFFGACDYMPYDDYAEIKLVADPNTMSDPNNIVLARKSISSPDIGDHSSMDRWEYFEYSFEPQQAGKYDLVIGVYDVRDLIWNSYLAVDALRICKVPSRSDLNHDCWVNICDFSILASDWLKDCSDPNEICSPGTNISGSGVVDMGDMNLFLDDWLFDNQ